MLTEISVIILGLLMGLISAISGGSGVFGVPIMLALGMSPFNVLALNRMSDVGVVFGALRSYHRSHNIDWKLALGVAVPMALGSFIGSKAVLGIPVENLRWIILGGVLVGIVLLLWRSKTQANYRPTRLLKVLGIFFIFLVGIWSGALAMAGATFAVLVMVYFFGKNFLQARSTDIVAAIPETLISATILARGAAVPPPLLILMGVASFVGAWVGSHLAVRHGSNFIRKMMVAIAVVMIIKVVLDF